MATTIDRIRITVVAADGSEDTMHLKLPGSFETPYDRAALANFHHRLFQAALQWALEEPMIRSVKPSNVT